MKNVSGPQVVTATEALESPLPAEIQEALGELVGAAREGLLALSVGVGLRVVHELMEAEVTEIVGPKGKHDRDRIATRHGHEDGSMTLGGRRVPVSRPRIRSVDDEEHELPVASYLYFADRDPLQRAVMDRMLAGVSTRKFARVGEPVGENVERTATSTRKSTVSEMFIEKTRTALEELMARRLDDTRLAVMMLDGLEIADRVHVVALGVTTEGVKVPLGARLIIQRAVEEEFDSWLGRARYERRPERQRGLRNYDSGMRNGFRPRHLQTAEGELRIEIPQARESAQPFVSKLFPKWHCKRLLRTDPLKALIIGGFVRGLSTRDVESLCEEAGLGKTSRSTVSRVCAELHERFDAFCRRSLYDVNLVVLFLDAIYLPVRRSGPKEGVICAWGITENGERALVSVRLGMRETKEDWLELGRDLTARGLPAPRLVVADGAAGLPSAVEEIWPRADRQLPKSEHDRIRFNYWSALTDATSVKDGKLRLKVLISELEHGGYESAARCLADDLDALVVHLRYPLRHRERWRSTNLLERSLGEVRRRTKVMGRFPGETSCLSLVWAVLDLFFSHASNGATFTDVDRQHLYRIKYQQADPDTLDEEATAA